MARTRQPNSAGRIQHKAFALTEEIQSTWSERERQNRLIPHLESLATNTGWEPPRVSDPP
jgi:hypothetical protein